MHISSTYYKSQNDVAAICPGNIKIVNQRKLQQTSERLRMYLYNQAKKIIKFRLVEQDYALIAMM